MWSRPNRGGTWRARGIPGVGTLEHPLIRGLTEWKPLARGGAALVWRARQPLLDRSVAVKVYQGELNGGGSGTFTREAIAVGRLGDHPGVVTAYHAGVLADHRPYLVLELCPGGSLTPWLHPEHRPGEDTMIAIGIGVADALAAAHRSGVIHCDVKPANILLDSLGRPRLADFGLAALVGAEAEATDPVRLTPAYAPPEALTGPTPTEAGDVFSLAATLYALLAGRAPRQVALDADRAEVVEALGQPIAPLPGVNWFLMDVVMSGLSTDPADRPTAAELADRLRALTAPSPTRQLPRPSRDRPLSVGWVAGTDRPVPTPPGSPTRGRRRRAGVLTLTVALAAVVVSSAAWLLAEPVSSSAPGTSRTDSGPTADRTPGPAATPLSAVVSVPDAVVSGADPGAAPRSDEAQIRVQESVHTAAPFQTVPVRGTYSGGVDTFVRIERWEDGRWRAFPVPAKTDRAGAFTAYVELAQPRRHRLRVVDDREGVTSEPFVVVIAQ